MVTIKVQVRIANLRFVDDPTWRGIEGMADHVQGLSSRVRESAASAAVMVSSVALQ
jgi:hypothetical protein